MNGSQPKPQVQIHRSINLQLLLLVLAVALPLIALALYGVYSIVQKETEQAYDIALDLAQLTSIHIEELLSDAENVLAQLAERPLVQAMDPDRCDPFLHEIAPLFSHYVGIRVIDLSGQVICVSERSVEVPLPSVADRAWFQEISRTRSFTVGDVQIGRIATTWIAPLAHPIFNQQGEFVGVVSMPID